jgi:beta-glucosidase
MSKKIGIILAAFVLFVISCKNNKTEIDKKVENLLKKMTLKEKVGQMSQIDLATFNKRVSPTGDFYRPAIEPNVLDKDSLQKYIVDYAIGSVFNIGTHGYTVQQWYEIIKEIQDLAVNNTRLGIPVIYGFDAIHGAALTIGATVFPHQLAMASTWNPDLVEKAGEITAYEMRASNIVLNFGPSLDLGKHPLWSRLMESYGEDVFLTRRLSVSAVKGMEGKNNDIGNKYKICTNIKHYLAYGFPLSGKDRTQSWIPEHYMREYFLPPFADCIKAGAHTILLSSGEVNGIPIHSSKYWITDVLRNEVGFEGVVITDWRDVEKLQYIHNIAETYKEAVKISIDAGIDINMVPYDNKFMDLLIELVNEGKIKEKRIDESVRRILKVKFELGLFERPYHELPEYPDFGSEKFRQLAKQCALESIILLKNTNNILPLPKNTKVLVTGPTANNMQALNGGWTYSWQGTAADTYANEKNTILEAIQKKIGEQNVFYAKGSDFNEIADLKNALEKARKVDYILLCLGEHPYSESPGYIEDLYLPDPQIELAKAMISTGKPVILILSEGRPRLISKFEDKIMGAILSFLPGNEGGDAFADVLFGDFNPEGKLPVTYPKYPNNLINYDHKYADRFDHEFGYTKGYNPQYPFGFGLSYTSFNYSNLTVNKKYFGFNDTVLINVDVENTGKIEGKEVVQLYIRDMYAKIIPPYRRLRGFEKINLKPGEKKTVTFVLSINDIKYVDANNKWTTDEGEFKVYIDKLENSFFLKK